MTVVPASPRFTTYTLASATAGPFLVGFRIFDATLQVYVNDALRTDYTVSATFSGGFSDTASITFAAALSIGDVVRIDGDMPIARGAEYLNPDPSLTTKINTEMGRIWAAMQQLARDVGWLENFEAGYEDIANLSVTRFASMAEARAFVANGGSFTPGWTYDIAGTQFVGRTGANAYPGLPNLSKQVNATYSVTDGPSGVIKGPYLAIQNDRNEAAYLGPLLTIVNEGRPTGGNQIGDTILYFSNEQSVSVWGKWEVISTPLPFGSGLFNAPTVLPAGRSVTTEVNPQARSMAPGPFKAEHRLYPGNPMGGEQTIPETNDFTATLGGLRIGYDITHGYLLGRSPSTANYGGTFEHARILAGFQAVPNTFAADGYGIALYGGKTYIKTVAIAAGGTGYAVNDEIRFNSGLSATLNMEATVKVLTVNGSGTILTAELLEAGGYVASFAATVPTTGGTGTGATFTYTLSTTADDPAALLGAMGRWDYVLDGCAGGDPAMYAACVNGFIRLPNAQKIVGRNAANSADVDMLQLNASNRGVLMGLEIIPWTAYTATVTSQTGSITVTLFPGQTRWSRINNTVTVNVAFQITASAAGNGAIYVTLPVDAAKNSAGCGRVTSGSTNAGLSVYVTAVAPTRMEILLSTGPTAIVVNDLYHATLVYEVA
jgi:hypothetical protein